LSIEYHITIFTEDCEKSHEWWVRKFGILVTSIKALRKFDIRIELVQTKSIHKRAIVSNYVVGKTDRGYDVFHAKITDKIKLDNDFAHHEIFSNLDNSGTKHYDSASITLAKLDKIGRKVCALVKANNKTDGYKLFGCNPDKTIKNRLLN
jgi:hypothetical protein